MRYDLTEFRRIGEVKLEEAGRWMLYGGAGVFAAVFAYGVTLFATNPDAERGPGTLVGVTIFCGAFIAVLLWPTRHLASNPE